MRCLDMQLWTGYLVWVLEFSYKQVVNPQQLHIDHLWCLLHCFLIFVILCERDLQGISTTFALGAIVCSLPSPLRVLPAPFGLTPMLQCDV